MATLFLRLSERCDLRYHVIPHLLRSYPGQGKGDIIKYIM